MFVPHALKVSPGVGIIALGTHEQVHPTPGADDRRRDAGHRCGDEDDVGAIANGVDDGPRTFIPYD